MPEALREHRESAFQAPSPLVEPKTGQWLRQIYGAAEQIRFGGLSLDETKARLDAQAGARESTLAAIGPDHPVPAPTVGSLDVPAEEKNRYLLSRGWKEAYVYAVNAESLGYPIAMAMSNGESSIQEGTSDLTLVQAVKKYAAAHLLGSYCAEAFNLLKRPDEDALEIDMFRTQFSAQRLLEDRFDRAVAIEERVLKTPHIGLLYNILVIDYLGRILDTFAPKAAKEFSADANALCQEASRELQARLRDTANALKTHADPIHNLTALTDMLNNTVVVRLRDGGALNTSLRTILSERLNSEFTLDVDGLSGLADQVQRAMETPAGLTIEPATTKMPFIRYLRDLRERMRLLFEGLLSHR